MSIDHPAPASHATTFNVANAPKSVLSAWTALEVLSPPTFREPEDLANGDKRALVRFTDRCLPWENDGERPQSTMQLYYRLILGAINLQAAMQHLTARYQDSAPENRPDRGRAVIACVLLDQAGVPVREKSADVSSFAWGLPRALAGRLESLGEWPTAEKSLNENLTAQLRRLDADGVAQPLTVDSIKQIYEWLTSSLGLSLTPDLLEAPSFALRVYKHTGAAAPPEPLVLNSFFLKFLALASEQFSRNTASSNLKLFLGSAKPGRRRDLLNDTAALMAAIRPHLFSPARWPGPGRHPLVLLQQAAVNLALDELKDHGILAVNGPPGTGKTTLLRDIVAALITERARLMAEMDDPAAAFAESDQYIEAGNGRFRIHRLCPALRGFEILVASSNNKAVENISAELPAAAAIAADAPGLRYFKTTSDALQTPQRTSTWGLIAAVLGNTANRAHFRKIFWWDKDAGLGTYLLAASGTPQSVQHLDPETEEVIERAPRIVTDEHAPSGREEALLRWREARAQFKAALRKSQETMAEISALHSLDTAEHALRTAHHSLEASEQDLARHLQVRPPWWKDLLLSLRSRHWHAEAGVRRQRIRATTHAVRQLQTQVGELQRALQHSVRARTASGSSTMPDTPPSTDDAIHALREKLGPRLVDERFFARHRTDYQQEAPWLDDTTHHIRDDVFVAAMQLHKAFVDAAAKPLRHNLGALMTLFGGARASSHSAENEALHAELWASLFLVVPVVSTTFASIERMLGKLPQEALGWLLIDEAGQATPQAAVGALMRTRRAVVVGDPMQIEPVVTLPASLTETICRRFNVDPHKFNAPAASVQTLADEATSCVAEFAGVNGNRTVGVPLLIHRRCAEPMFGLSNTVAYDRLMISARTQKTSPIRAVLGASRWFDVQGETLDKWCPQEGHCVIQLLRLLARGNIEPDLYVVTPFVLVQDKLRETILKSGVLDGWIADPRDWVRQRVGTVHVVQGREAEAVIFVLGAQGLQQAGARQWAGGRPNLLNVAASRAKEALYVVGNRALWRGAGLFAELDAHMPESGS